MTVMDFQLGYSPADVTSPLIEYLDQVLLVWVVVAVAVAVDVTALSLFCCCMVLGVVEHCRSSQWLVFLLTLPRCVR